MLMIHIASTYCRINCWMQIAKLSINYLVCRAEATLVTSCTVYGTALGCPLPLGSFFLQEYPITRSPEAICTAQNASMWSYLVCSAKQRTPLQSLATVCVAALGFSFSFSCTMPLGPFCKNTPSPEAISTAQGPHRASFAFPSSPPTFVVAYWPDKLVVAHRSDL